MFLLIAIRSAYVLSLVQFDLCLQAYFYDDGKRENAPLRDRVIISAIN